MRRRTHSSLILSCKNTLLFRNTRNLFIIPTSPNTIKESRNVIYTSVWELLSLTNTKISDCPKIIINIIINWKVINGILQENERTMCEVINYINIE